MTTQPLRTDGYQSGDRSRQELLDTALHLFAQHGIDAVSMRRIASDAGQANVSAAQYYFGNKLNIVKAVLQELHAHIAQQRQTELDEAEHFDIHDPNYVVNVLGAAFAPHFAFLLEGQRGQDAIQFLARVVWEAGPEGRKALIEPFGDDMIRVVALLQRGLPKVPAKTLQLRFMFSLGNLLHGLADLPILEDSPFGPLLDQDSKKSAKVLEEFLHYMAAGISH